MQHQTNLKESTLSLPVGNEIQTPGALADTYPNLFSKRQIDWLLKTRDKNGLAKSGAVLKVSRKLYINTPAFFKWFYQQKA